MSSIRGTYGVHTDVSWYLRQYARTYNDEGRSALWGLGTGKKI